MKTFAEWMANNPPPALADLIAEHGGYQRIPLAAWKDFDERMERWQAAYRARHFER